MFYPQEMTEVEMIVPAKDLLAVTNVLADQGIFHQVDASYLSSEVELGAADSWQEKAAAYAALERRLLMVMQTLRVKESAPTFNAQASIIEIEAITALIEPVEQEVKKISEQLASRHKKLDQTKISLHQLEPVADLDLDLSEIRNPRYIFSILGTIPAANLERLKTSLVRTPFVLLTLRQDNQKCVVWLAGSQNNADILNRAARSAYLNPLNIPDTYQGTPTEIIATLQANIQETQQEIDRLEAALSDLRQTRQQEMQTLLWQVGVSRMLANAIAHFGRLRHTYLIVGWVPSVGLVNLTQQLRQASSQTLIDTTPSKRSTANGDVPVALRNPGILGAFQPLVTTYAQPSYEEIDPTLLIMLTFPLLFGAMFGDVGHGLILFLLGLLLRSRKVEALRSMASLGTVIVACGASATVFGFLYGSIFGLEETLPALWLQPMENIMTILIVAVGAGVILLSTGFLIGILNAWLVRDWGRLFFDHNGIAGCAFYWSMLGLAASVMIDGFPVSPTVIAIPLALAGVSVMFSEVLKRLVAGHRPLVDEGLGTYFIQAFFELFEILISLFSNSLSYVRVGAFAVAHGGLSAVIFILAELVGPSGSVGYWLVLILGNLFIVGFEGLIVGIQTMRLEYYEFFSKFFRGSGLRYKPLTLMPTTEN